jgi:hypothetical protein
MAEWPVFLSEPPPVRLVALLLLLLVLFLRV